MTDSTPRRLFEARQNPHEGWWGVVDVNYTNHWVAVELDEHTARQMAAVLESKKDA